jgi:hypothetical protein
MSPLDEDNAVCAIAETFGFEIFRYEAFEVTDKEALKASGMMIQKPDNARIRKAIQEGATVPGVRSKGMQYILSPASPLPDNDR